MKFSTACWFTLFTAWLLLHLGLGLLLLLLLPRLLLLLNGSHILLLLSRPGVLLLCWHRFLLLLLKWFLIWMLRRPLLDSSLGICLIGLRALGLLCYLTSWGSLSIYWGWLWGSLTWPCRSSLAWPCRSSLRSRLSCWSCLRRPWRTWLWLGRSLGGRRRSWWAWDFGHHRTMTIHPQGQIETVRGSFKVRYVKEERESVDPKKKIESC